MRQGLVIKLRRIELEKKQIDFAKELGISREYLRLIEAGKAKNPSIALMKRISKGLNSSVQELFFSDED